MNASSVTLRLPASLLEALDRHAESQHRSRANMVAVMVQSALAEQADTIEKENTE